MSEQDQRADERHLSFQQEREQIDLQEVSNAMVRLYKDLFGRGPTKAKSALASEDFLVCTLENSLTPAEQNMAKAGDHQRLRELRLYFQHASEKEFVGAVEDITGRKVRAFTSAMDVHADLAIEGFHFHPVGTPFGHADRSKDELAP